MLIEIVTFRPATGVAEATFLEADKRAQDGFYNLQPGMLRRTTSRADDGEWMVQLLWWSSDQADAAHARAAGDPAAGAFASCVDPATLRTRRYHTLD